MQLGNCQNICVNYVPFVSQGMRLSALFCGRRYEVLRDEGLVRTVIAMVPVLGNIAIFLYDLVIWYRNPKDADLTDAEISEAQETLKTTCYVGGALNKMRPVLREYMEGKINESILRVREDCQEFKQLDEWLRGVPTVVKVAILQDESLLDWVEPKRQQQMRTEIEQIIIGIEHKQVYCYFGDGAAIVGYMTGIERVVKAAFAVKGVAMCRSNVLSVVESERLRQKLDREMTEAIRVVSDDPSQFQYLDKWLQEIPEVRRAAHL